MKRAGSIATLLCAVASPAHAAPGEATRLEYARSERAAHCPDRDTLKAAVSKRLGYDPFFHAARQTVVVSITDDDAGGLRAQLSLVDEKGIIVGSRELRERAEHCDELVASLALAISIALDPSAAMGEEPEPPPAAPPPSKPEPEPEPEPEPVHEEPLAKKKAPPVPPSTPIPIKLRASAFATTGVAPSLAWGARLGADVRWRSLQVIAEAAYEFPAAAKYSGGSAEARLYSGTLAPCFALDAFAGCATLQLGSLRTAGRDLPDPATRSLFYAALGARFEYAPVLVGKLRLLLNADAFKSLTPVTLRLRGEEVWKTPFVSLALGVGLAVQFP